MRDAKKAMEAAVQSGDIKAAQQNLATIQQDTQSLQSARGTGDAQQDSNPYRSVLKTDLSNLMAAVQQDDIGAAQSALQTFQEDRQSLLAPNTNDVASSSPSSTDSPFLDDLKTLLDSALSSDASGVQNAATALQKDLQAAFGVATPDSSQSAAITSASDQPQNSFADDMKALIDAAQSGDTTGAQTSAKKLAQDIQNAVGAVSGGRVGGHHQHHHHHSTEAESAANNPAATPSQDGEDADQNNQSAVIGAQTSGSKMSSELKNAREAYELLMTFSQESAKAG